MPSRSPAETPVSFVGCGAVGRTLARALADAGYRIGGIVCRSARSARAARRFVGAGRATCDPATACRTADIVFITTPDDAIEGVCAGIAGAGGFRRGQVVLHCSGALTSEVLQPARELAAAAGSLHPLQSFSRPREALEALPGTYFGFEGDDDAYRRSRRLVSALKGRIFRIEPKAKPLYHAASAVASNYLVAVEHLAASLLAGAGLAPAEALSALMPLINGTVRNLERVGLPDALTGPIARGDVETVARHLEALAGAPRRARELYRALGLATVEVARSKGSLTESRARHLRRLLKQPPPGRERPRG